jgi:hypothetical protein
MAKTPPHADTFTKDKPMNNHQKTGIHSAEHPVYLLIHPPRRNFVEISNRKSAMKTGIENTILHVYQTELNFISRRKQNTKSNEMQFSTYLAP